MSERARPLATAALSAGSAVATLLILEMLARVFADPTGGYRDILAQREQARVSSVHTGSADPELVYVTRPGYVTNGVRISESHGVVRRDDVGETKPAGVFRVIVLGDSIAAAHPIRVGGAPSFPEEMERRLNARPSGRRFEVLNFGTDGYGTAQEARRRARRAGRFEPDLILVQDCLNDPANSYTPTVWFLDGKEPPSYLLDLVRRHRGLTPSELSPAHPRYTHGAIDWKRLYETDGEAWRRVRSAFSRIATWAGERHVPAALALFPLLLDGRESASERALVERLYPQIREAAVAEGMRVVDLGPAFAAHGASRLRLLPDDPVHPGAFGHGVAAEAILAALDEGGRLPPR